MTVQNNAMVAAVVFALSACGGGGEGAAEATGDESGGGEATAYEGPIASADVELGKQVFMDSCDDCHPDGGEDVGPSLIGDPHSPAQLRRQVREGSGRMRPFPPNRLSDEELEALLAYLATIQAVL